MPFEPASQGHYAQCHSNDVAFQAGDNRGECISSMLNQSLLGWPEGFDLGEAQLKSSLNLHLARVPLARGEQLQRLCRFLDDWETSLNGKGVQQPSDSAQSRNG